MVTIAVDKEHTDSNNPSHSRASTPFSNKRINLIVDPSKYINKSIYCQRNERYMKYIRVCLKLKRIQSAKDLELSNFILSFLKRVTCLSFLLDISFRDKMPHMCTLCCTAVFRHQYRAEYRELVRDLAPHRSTPSAEDNASTCGRLRCNTPISWVTDGGDWEGGEKTRHWPQQHIREDVRGIKNIDYPASSSPLRLQFRWMRGNGWVGFVPDGYGSQSKIHSGFLWCWR